MKTESTNTAAERRLPIGQSHRPRWHRFDVAIVAAALLAGCTNSLDQADDNFRLPFAKPDKQRLLRMVDEFCAPDDQLASPDHLPLDGRSVNIPPVLWQRDVPVHILYSACNFGVRSGARRVNIPAGGILVAEPESPLAPDLLDAMYSVDGIEIADAANADAILDSLRSFKHKYLLLRDLKLGKIGVEAINRMPNLKALIMYGVSTNCLAALDPSKLQELSVKAIDPDEQLAQLFQHCKTMDKLTNLDLDDSAISDSMSAGAGKVPKLKSLAFDGSTLHDSQLIPWLACCNLKELGLHDTAITDNALKSLQSQSDLESLNISRCGGITDDGLVSVAKLPNLRKIDLCNTSVSDRGVLYLSRAPRLEGLALANTSITSACLPRFTAFKSLQHLSLGHNNLPFDAIQRLKQQMPHCKMSE